MILNFDNIDISAETILNKVSEEDIYNYYLGENIKEGQLHCCPFHKDDSPSLGFKLMPSNSLIYKCFGCGEKGTVFKFVQELLGISYRDALKQIHRDLISGIAGPVSSLVQRQSEGFSANTSATIFPIFQNFSITDYNYWKQYYIPLQLLNEYNVRAVKQVYLRKRSKELVLFAEYSKSNPIYCYTVDRKHKIYRPLNPVKQGKWLSTMSAEDIQGMKELPATGSQLIITSSMKDVLVLRVLGYNAIAMGSESSGIPAKLLDYLFACFEDIVIFYDNDEAGIKYAKKLSLETEMDYIYIPEEFADTKDISDYIREYGDKQAGCLIKTLLDGNRRKEVHNAEEVRNTLQ